MFCFSSSLVGQCNLPRKDSNATYTFPAPCEAGFKTSDNALKCAPRSKLSFLVIQLLLSLKNKDRNHQFKWQKIFLDVSLDKQPKFITNSMIQ